MRSQTRRGHLDIEVKLGVVVNEALLVHVTEWIEERQAVRGELRVVLLRRDQTTAS